MKNIFPTLGVVLFLTAFTYVICMPIKMETQQAALRPIKASNAKMPLKDTEALKAFRAWKQEYPRWSQDLQNRLIELEKEFPNSYIITLERLRTEKNNIGIAKSEEHFELLNLAAHKAILEGKSEEMWQDIERHRFDKKEGFGRISLTDRKKWNAVRDALKNKNAKLLRSPKRP